MLHQYNSDRWRIERKLKDNETEQYEVIVTKSDDPSMKFTYHCAMNNGISMMTCLPQTRFDKIDSNLRYRDTDIMISTYPKCGTTWTEHLVLLLLNGARPELLNPVTKNAYDMTTKQGKLWPEAMILNDVEPKGGQFYNLPWEEFDNAPAPRVMKCHMPVPLLYATKDQGVSALPKGMKILVVTRNPLDACVSSYYHAFNPFKSGWPFDAWATLFLNGYCHFGNYSDWVKGWYEQYQRHADQICWVQYETLKADPFSEIQRIAKFLNIPQADDDQFILSVAEHSSFREMKKQSEAKGGDDHLRKGIVGDWRNHFHDEHLFQLFQQHFSEELNHVAGFQDLSL